MNNLILIPELEPVGFSDNLHLQNFIKYLFSYSKGHPANNSTKDNHCSYENSGKLLFTDMSNQSFVYNDFKNSNWNSFDYMTNINNIIYPFFILDLNGKVCSNIVSGKMSDLSNDLEEEFYWKILSDYGLSGDDLNILINSVLKTVNGSFIHCFYSLPINEKHLIDKLVYQEIRSQLGEDLILVTHHDQDSVEKRNYHIHRLFVQ